MSAQHESLRVAIVGATSLRGKDLKEWIEESNFPVSEIRLLDEEIVAGTLTEASGEPAVVETVSEDSFERVRFAFFTGSAGFSVRHEMEARRSGAVVVDLSGGLRAEPDAKSWIPYLDSVLPPPGKVSPGEPQNLYLVPSTPSIIAISISAALAPLGVERLAFTFLQPASERGPEGIEELESQIAKLLTFQPIPRTVFDTQVAFNMISRFGPESSQKLADVRANVVSEVRNYLAGRLPMPGIALIQAPVFHAHAFTAYATFKTSPDTEDLTAHLLRAGLKLTAAEDDPPTNVNVAAEGRPVLGQPERDPGIENGVWIWGAADNLRVPATTAVAIAEKLLAS